MGLLLSGMIIVSVGLLMTTVGVLTLGGELPINRVVGICVPTITQSERHWEVGHRAAAPVNIGFGVAVQLMGGLIAVQPTSIILRQTLIGSAWALAAAGMFLAWRLALTAATDLR